MVKNNILLLIGLIILAYLLMFLWSPRNIDHTIIDTEYWKQTQNRLIIKEAFGYNDKDIIRNLPKELGEWKSFDFNYSANIYKVLNADILMSRGYKKDKKVIYVDIINSKTGESFHKQKICAEGAGWNIDKEDIIEFKILNSPNPFTKFYANRLDLSKKNSKQVIFYWFMFKQFGNRNAVTMIRITSPVFANDSINESFDRAKVFIEDQLFNSMYELSEKENISNYENILKEYGIKGLVAIFIGLFIPIGMILAILKRKK